MIDSPHQIEERIMELDRRLDAAIQEMARRSEAFAEADATYHTAYHQAILKIRDGEKGLPRNERSTVDEVEARAAVETQNEYRDRARAEALLKSVQAAQRARQSQMEGQRSLAANVRFLLEKAP